MKLNSHSFQKNKLSYGFLRNAFFLSSLCIIGWILWNSFFAVPSVDDFCYATWTRMHGVLGNVKYVYLEVSGRFTSTLLISSFTASRTIFVESYYIIPFVILSCIYFSLKYFLKFFGIQDFKYLTIFFVIVISSLSFRETIFWLSGGITYSLGISLFIFISIIEYKIVFKDAVLNPIRIIFVGFLTIVLSGFNETILLCHIVFSIYLLCAGVLSRISRQKLLALIAILLTSLIGALIAKFSPGNVIRSTSIPNNPQVIVALLETCSIVVFAYWKPFLLGVVIFLASLLVMRPAIKVESKDCMSYIGAMCSSLIASVFVREYVVGNLGPLRAQSIDHLLIALSTFLIALLIYSKIQNIGFTRVPKIALTALISITLSSGILLKVGADNSQFIVVLMDMRYAKNLHQYMSNRNTKLSGLIGDKVSVENFSGKNQIITFFDDIQGDPSDWRNRCLAYYFELDQVFLIN